MKRAVLSILLLAVPQMALAANTPWRAAWHQVEVFPEVQPGADAYNSKEECDVDLAESKDMIVRCAYLAKPKDAMDAAIAVFSEFVKSQPDNDVIINQRGNLYADKGDTKHAIADYTRAIALKPDVFWAYVLRASVYQKMGKREQAIADYKAAIARNPDADTLASIQKALTKLGATP